MDSKALMKKRAVAIVLALIVAIGLSLMASGKISAAQRAASMPEKMVVKYFRNDQESYVNKYLENN